MPKKVRILVDTHLNDADYTPNQVVQLTDAIAKSLTDIGAADDSPDAVDYAIGLPGNTLIVHDVADPAA